MNRKKVGNHKSVSFRTTLNDQQPIGQVEITEVISGLKEKIVISVK